MDFVFQYLEVDMVGVFVVWNVLVVVQFMVDECCYQYGVGQFYYQFGEDDVGVQFVVCDVVLGDQQIVFEYFMFCLFWFGG